MAVFDPRQWLAGSVGFESSINSINTTKEKSMHDAIYELRNSKLTDNERYALRRGLIKGDGILTENGRQVFTQWLFNNSGEKFLSELRDLSAKEEARVEAIDTRDFPATAPVATQE